MSRTTVVSGIGAVLVIGSLLLATLQVAGEDVGVAVGSMALVAAPLFAALTSLWAAREIGFSKPVRWQWILLGLGATSFALGQAMEEFYFRIVEAGIPQYSVATVLFLLAPPLFGAGIGTGIVSFKGFLQLRRPLIIAGVVSAVITVVAWPLALASEFAAASGDLIAQMLVVYYPLAVLWMMFAPTLALALIVGQMGGGAIAVPWRIALGGVAIMTLSNLNLVAGFVPSEIPNAGVTEIGWWIGLSLIAIAAARAVDVQKPRSAAPSQGVGDNG